MSVQPFRTASGGRIDRDQPQRFTFNGESLTGFAGDTVASALLANGKRLVARSFKYHRPRGIFSAGPEEPSALLSVDIGGTMTPNTRATRALLQDGMQVRTQNHWPTLAFDLLRLNDRLSPILSTGFYNKTFKWPRRFWPLYERVLRSIAGLGPSPLEPDTSNHEHRHHHCDVLIVGAGPAGLAAAATLAGSGASIVVTDEGAQPGGWLLRENATVAGLDSQAWCDDIAATLDAADNVRVLNNTTAFGYYDHNLVALVERMPSSGTIAERLWRIRAAQVILATGSIERPLVFPNNDLPGVMLAGAARAYLHQYGVLAGHRAVIATDNDSAYRSALDLHDAGVSVAAAIDTRESVDPAIVQQLAERAIPVIPGATPIAHGDKSVHAVTAAGAGGRHEVDCDLLCVSGGWTPTVHLHAQSGGRSRYVDERRAFVPGEFRQPAIAAGAVNGLQSTADCLADGERAAFEIAERLGLATGDTRIDTNAELLLDGDSVAPATTPAPPGKCFVDLQNDVTTSDVSQAFAENYVSVEHLKRYTTLGMGTDQGKTSNLNGLAMLAGLRDEAVPEVGTTTFRPPYTPVTLGALAGHLKDERLVPTRRTVLHGRHKRAGAIFDSNGLWLRPQCYPRGGESVADAINREALAVRQHAGITDISTLGKIEITGPDCVEFLNRAYINDWDHLSTGRSKYGLMLRDDGMVLDDGTVTRIGDEHFFLTVSSGHAEHVVQHFEFLLDVCWPELDVCLVPVTEQWAGVALAGPASRGILEQCIEGVDLAALPFMAYAEASIDGDIPARILRISFSGELAHEIYVPARAGTRLWDSLMNAGEDAGLVPYGMDAMDVLRIEKGFIVVGADADGRTAPEDLGFGRMVSKNNRFVGWHALQRPALAESGRLQLVGLKPVDGSAVLREGAQLIANAGDHGFGSSIGHISSAGFSPTLGRYVALALVADGHTRHGETIFASDAAREPGPPCAVEITEPCAFDPAGERVRA